MKIRVGEIVNLNHKDANGKKNLHPFLIVSITSKNIYLIQCSSAKIKDNQSYFSRNRVRYYEFKFSNLEYVTHITLEEFVRFSNLLFKQNYKGSKAMSKKIEFDEICQILINNNWKSTKLMSNVEVIQQIERGIRNYGKVWEVENSK